MNVMNLTSGQRERLRVAMLDMTKAEQRSVRASLTVGGPLAKKLAGIEGEARPAQAIKQRQPLSDARRAAISAALKGKPKTRAHRAAISAAMEGKPRKPQTEEHRAAISEGKKGKPLSEAHRAALKVAQNRPDVKAKRRAAGGARPGREAATEVGNNE